jgi:hypothetical protein
MCATRQGQVFAGRWALDLQQSQHQETYQLGERYLAEQQQQYDQQRPPINNYFDQQAQEIDTFTRWATPLQKLIKANHVKFEDHPADCPFCCSNKANHVELKPP